MRVVSQILIVSHLTAQVFIRLEKSFSTMYSLADFSQWGFILKPSPPPSQTKTSLTWLRGKPPRYCCLPFKTSFLFQDLIFCPADAKLSLELKNDRLRCLDHLALQGGGSSASPHRLDFEWVTIHSGSKRGNDSLGIQKPSIYRKNYFQQFMYQLVLHGEGSSGSPHLHPLWTMKPSLD